MINDNQRDSIKKALRKGLEETDVKLFEGLITKEKAEEESRRDILSNKEDDLSILPKEERNNGLVKRTLNNK